MSLLKIRQFSIDQSDTFTFANANVTGNLNSGNANLGNLAIANFFSGNGNALFSIQGANVVGTVGNATLATNVTASAQSNITSVGSLTGLTVSNATGIVDFTTTANVTLGSIANLHISGGSANYVLKTDGSGGLSWTSMTAGTGNANVGGSNTQIQYNDGTNLAGSANLTFNSTSKTLTVDNIVANGSGLTSITGANVTGAVAYATTANAVAGSNVSGAVAYATTANAVAGANVSGAVSYATTANSVAGANVSGEVAYANIANSVAGANVSGFVANANVANTAYSVAGANVTGAVSYATTANSVAGANVSGEVAYANIANNVAGANVSGQVNYAATANAVAGANVTGAVSYATTANAVAGANVSGQVGNALVAGTVYTNAQPNITSVGTLTSLSVTGDIGAANLTLTGNLVISGTTTSVNSTVTTVVDPIFELGGGANGAALSTDDNKDRGVLLHYYSGGSTVDAFMGWDDSNGEFGIGSNVTVTNEVITWNSYSNVRANVYFGNGSQLTGVSATTSGQTANGTSNVSIATADGNITMGVGGASNVVVVTTTGVNVTGYITSSGNITSGNANLGNLATANYFSGSGNLLSNIQGANVSGAVSYATTANSVAGANVSGEVSFAATANAVAGANVSGTVSSATTAGTVTTAAQGNITSLGTLTGLTVTGNVALSGANVTLGAVGNLHISGGSANYYLKTDGSGALSWAAVPTTSMNVDTFTGDGTWTMKTLTATPTDINYTLVAIGGVFQPRDAYAVSTNVITFDDPPPNGAIVEITTVVAGAAAGGGGGGASWTYSAVSANTSAVAGYRYIVDTSTANLTITLPASATLGDEVMIIDGTGNASTHEITVDKNGGKIQGSATNMTVNTDRAAFTLVYYNSAQGWILTNV